MGGRLNQAGLTIPFNSGNLIQCIYECRIKITAAGGLTGTLLIPKAGGGYIDTSKYTIRLREYSETESCLVWKMDGTGTYKTNELAETATGALVTVTLSDSVPLSGDNRVYTIPTAPSAYPVILTFVVISTLGAMNNADQAYVSHVKTMISVVTDGTTTSGSGIPGDPVVAIDTLPDFTAAGTDTYTGTVAGVTSYTAGDRCLVKFTNANTGASTLNINTLGAKALVKNVSDALVAADIAAGKELIVVYDGTNFQVIGIGGGTTEDNRLQFCLVNAFKYI